MKKRYYGLIAGAVLSIIPLGLVAFLTEINAPQAFLIVAGIISMIFIFPLQILANIVSPDIPNLINLMVLITFWGAIGFLIGKATESKNKPNQKLEPTC